MYQTLTLIDFDMLFPKDCNKDCISFLKKKKNFIQMPYAGLTH